MYVHTENGVKIGIALYRQCRLKRNNVRDIYVKALLPGPVERAPPSANAKGMTMLHHQVVETYVGTP